MAARINSALRQLEQREWMTGKHERTTADVSRVVSLQKNVKDELQQVLDDLAPLVEAQGLDAAQLARGYELALGGHLCESVNSP